MLTLLLFTRFVQNETRDNTAYLNFLERQVDKAGQAAAVCEQLKEKVAFFEDRLSRSDELVDKLTRRLKALENADKQHPLEQSRSFDFMRSMDVKIEELIDKIAQVEKTQQRRDVSETRVLAERVPNIDQRLKGIESRTADLQSVKRFAQEAAPALQNL